LLVILKRLLLALKDLGVPREQFRVFCEIAKTRVWHASLIATTREEGNTTQNRVNFGRFGLFLVLLGRFPTGSSLSAPNSHGPYCSHHFVPLLSTSYP
jgi:hypothetical protein